MVLDKLFDFFLADEEYNQSKRIKLGEEELTALFDELADWIRSRWDIPVLNITYKNIDSERSDINVEFEREEEYIRFRDPVHEQKQDVIEKQFLKLIARQNLQEFELRNVMTGWERLLGRFRRKKESIPEELYVSFHFSNPRQYPTPPLKSQRWESIIFRRSWRIRCYGKLITTVMK